jgi:hypothetical protein
LRAWARAEAQAQATEAGAQAMEAEAQATEAEAQATETEAQAAEAEAQAAEAQARTAAWTSMYSLAFWSAAARLALAAAPRVALAAAALELRPPRPPLLSLLASTATGSSHPQLAGHRWMPTKSRCACSARTSMPT